MLHQLENAYWQVVIDSQTGGNINSGRIWHDGAWVDVMREATPASFLMLPWANRIRDGILRYDGQTWQLKTQPDDGTARHGDVRKRPWQVMEHSATRIHMRINSRDFDDFNYPFALSAELVFALDGADFVWQVTLTNEDTQAFPAGFGFHPYWHHSADNMPLLQIPCNAEFVLKDAMADSAPVPISERLDFRTARAVTDDMQIDDLLTDRIADEPIKLIYAQWHKELHIIADAIFEQVIVYTSPDGSLAVEVQTNANDGFNLRENGIEGHGVFVLEPGASISGTVRLRLV